MRDDDQLRDLVRGDALTRRVLSLYPSKRKLTGRLMSVAENLYQYAGGGLPELKLESQ